MSQLFLNTGHRVPGRVAGLGPSGDENAAASPGEASLLPRGGVVPGARLLSRGRQSPGTGEGWQVLAQKGGRV